MKRQIDPNLNNSEDNSLSIEETIGIVADKISESDDSKGLEEIIGTITGETKSDEKVVTDLSLAKKDEVGSSEHRHRHHHHHSSDGENHHHSSSGEHHHHSSSGEHHHHSSSGDHHHHSSSGEHHHHSSSGEHHHHSSSSKHHHSSKKSSDKKKKSVVKKIILAIIAILLAIVLAITGTFFYLQSQGKKDVKPVITDSVEYKETIEYNEHTYQFNEDIAAFAFMGVDQRQYMTNDETDFVGSADSDIIITINTKTGEAKFISIPRDTMVDVDVYSESGMFIKTENMQLCLAYAYSDGQTKSCENVVKAMSRILYNVPIQKYFALNLEGIAPLNDAMGGVTVEPIISMPEYGIFKGQTITLKGDNAEHYVRTRDIDDIESSLNRADRQMQYVKSFVSQLVPAVMKDFGVVSQLYNTASKYSQTNISLSNVTYIASLALSKNVTTYETYNIKGEMKLSEKTKQNDIVYAEFTPDEDSLMETVLAVFYTQID